MVPGSRLLIGGIRAGGEPAESVPVPAGQICDALAGANGKQSRFCEMNGGEIKFFF